MECDICFLKFDFDERKPYILNPCGHSLCLTCSNKLNNCPHCRNKIVGKIVNFALMNMIENNKAFPFKNNQIDDNKINSNLINSKNQYEFYKLINFKKIGNGFEF